VYRKIEAARIVETANALHRRVKERFPGSGLSLVASELERVAREAAELSSWLLQPNYRVRALVGFAVLVLGGVVVLALVQLRGATGSNGWSDTVQGLEALVNDVVFVGVAVYFLLGIELRQKRARTMEALHVLRSLAHIIDMHQLTKDPDSISRGPRTASSPKREMTPFQLARYLDYSAEMLAIIGKIAAIYVQEVRDPVAVAAASGVEELAANLSRTIWSKITILDRVLVPEAPVAAG
jgi:hypothetical protein